MKKIYLFIAVLVSIFLLSSCGNVQKERPETETQLQETEQEIDLFLSIAPIQAHSVDEMITKIKNIKSGKDTGGFLKVDTIDKLIVPAFIPEGYELRTININPTNIQYTYVPASVLASSKYPMTDYERDFIISVQRHEFIEDKENPLKALVGQEGGFINEDGYIHIRHMRDITFAYDQTWVSVRYPKSFSDYNEIKQLCKAKTINID